VRRGQIAGYAISVLRQRKSRKRVDGRNSRKCPQNTGIGHCEQLLVGSVVAMGLQRKVLIEPIVEDARSASNDGLRLAPDNRARRPRERNARSKIQITADVCLLLVSQTAAQREIGARLPVILEEAAEIPLPHTCRGIAACDSQLRRLP